MYRLATVYRIYLYKGEKLCITNKLLQNLVEKYENLHNGENMIANRMDASVLDSVMRKPQTSPKGHADFLHMDYDRVM